MTSSDDATLADVEAKAAGAVAVEALWDGDTQGWFVDLRAVIKGELGYDSRILHSFSFGGDIRLFNGQVPPWPEALDAARIGRRLAALLGVPFHFPSPDHPEVDCPHWWEIDQSSSCPRCGVLLLQRQKCPWRGVCYHCHLAAEKAAREAAWSPEERRAPRCSLCGNPAVGETGTSPRCRTCRAVYRTFACPGCGVEVTVHRECSKADMCTSCATARRLAALSVDERKRLREVAAGGTIAALIAVREILNCGLGEAQDVLAELRRTSHDG